MSLSKTLFSTIFEYITYMSKGWRKYLLAHSIFLLALMSVFFRYALSAAEARLLREQAFEKYQDVGLLSALVDTLVFMDSNESIDYEKILVNAVSHIEREYKFTFAQVYDTDLIPLNKLSPGVGGGEKPNLLSYPAFIEAIYNGDSGHLIVWFETEEVGGRDVHVCFKWVPTLPEREKEYLIVIGVSKYTVKESVEPLVSYGSFALILMMFVYVICVVVYVCKLGYIYETRTGEKWRGRL